jgi:hypothetical protein
MYNIDHISYWEPLGSHSKMAKIQKIEKKLYAIAKKGQV